MTSTPQAALQELNQKTRSISILGSCASLLGWDERTYMPPGGVNHRAEQMAMIAGMTHEKMIEPRIGELINIVSNSDLMNGGSTDAAVIVREVGRSFERATKMPQALVEEITRTSSLAQNAWEEARAKRDFKIFKPWLAKMIDLKKQEAEAVGYKDDPYDALLDDFEPGATVKDIEKTLNGLRVELVKMLDKIKGASRRPKDGILKRRFPREAQEKFGREAADRIGFDFKRGRLDVTVHPFCTGIGPGDTRLTTRYDEHDFNNAFFGTMHESGHGIYDQGLPEDHFGTPLGDAISLGIHESQSRMWENQVGRSKSFWKYFYPKAKQTFSEALGDVTMDEFYFAINDVKPSFIRTESDEGTYNLHILIRFELERAFFAGQLQVDDVPEAWKKKYQDYLGITPPDDSIGCMQDVHWSAGLIGYFPTYSLGNLYSAQFFAQARKDLGDLDVDFAKGEFSRLKKWLNDNIHAHGRRYLATDLVKKVTGKPLSHDALMTYMNAKFGELYGF